MSCINAITVFSNDLLYRNDGKPGQNRTIIIGLFSLIVTVIVSVFIKKMGQIIPFMVSLGIVSTCLFVLSCEKHVLITLITFQCAFALGLGPLTWLITNVIFPEEYQSIIITLYTVLSIGHSALYDVILFQSYSEIRCICFKISHGRTNVLKYC